MPQIWVSTNVLHINLRPGGENSDLTPANKVPLLTQCAFVLRSLPSQNAWSVLSVLLLTSASLPPSLAGIPAAVQSLCLSQSANSCLESVKRVSTNNDRRYRISALSLSLSLSRRCVSGIFAHCTEELGCRRTVLGIGHFLVHGC